MFVTGVQTCALPICTIAVDVRYVLFVIDKFAGAKWLIDELSID